MKTRPLLIALAALVVAGFLGAYFASPFLAANALVAAARDHDTDGVAAKVDLPAVRASLKRQVDAEVDHAVSRRGDDGTMAQFGAFLGAALLDKAIDAIVTPETLAQAVRSARTPDFRKSAPAPDMADPPTGDAPRAGGLRTKTTYALSGLDRLEIRVVDKNDPGPPLVFVMTRRGLFDWKVSEVLLPKARDASVATDR